MGKPTLCKKSKKLRVTLYNCNLAILSWYTELYLVTKFTGVSATNLDFVTIIDFFNVITPQCEFYSILIVGQICIAYLSFALLCSYRSWFGEFFNYTLYFYVVAS